MNNSVVSGHSRASTSSTSTIGLDGSKKKKRERNRKSIPRNESLKSNGPIQNSNGEEEYVVERIIKKEFHADGKLYYRVKWKGWDTRYNTWEPEHNLRNCQDMIDEFERNEQARTHNSHKKRRKSTITEIKSPPVEELVVSDSSSGDEVMDEKEKLMYEKQLHSPMFQRELNPNQSPLCILGSSSDNGALLFLVRLKPETEEETKKVLAAPMEGLTGENCVALLSDYLKVSYPQLLIAHFEACAKLYDNQKDDSDQATEAAKFYLLNQFKKLNMQEKVNQIVKDLAADAEVEMDNEDVPDGGEVTEGQTGTNADGSWSPASSGGATDIVPRKKIDKFGLPNYDSELDSESDSGSSGSFVETRTNIED